jgi:hypothetical protein
MYITKHPSKRARKWLVYNESQDWLGVIHGHRQGVVVKMFDRINIGGKPLSWVREFNSLEDAKKHLEGLKIGERRGAESHR